MSAESTGDQDRPSVVVVAEAAPMRGGIATFAETITADERLQARFDIRLLNTARTSTREGGRFSLDNVRFALADAWRTFRASRRCDIVHLQLVADPGLPALRAAALNVAAVLGGAKVVAHVHSAVGNAGRPEFARYSTLDRAALRTLALTDQVCTVSNAGTATVTPFAGRTPVRTVDNAINLANWEPTTVDHEPATVLFVGVICKRKGTVELARAARLLRERGVTGWRLIVVGGQGPTPQPEFDDIVAEFAKAALSDSLVGPEYGPAIRQRLDEADIFVLPSYLEGQPIAIIEAMAAGVPVVGTSIGAVPDLIRDGVDGYVVDAGDVDGLADALRALIENPAIRRDMSRSIRARAEAHHSLEKLSAELAGIYRGILDAADNNPHELEVASR